MSDNKQNLTWAVFLPDHTEWARPLSRKPSSDEAIAEFLRRKSRAHNKQYQWGYFEGFGWYARPVTPAVSGEHTKGKSDDED